jgi:ribonuclease P protein component
MAGIARLKRRAEFLRVAACRRKWVTPGLILQAARRRNQATAEEEASTAPRVGFTASRKVGIAVARNRARRRLKAAADQVLALHAAPGHDYVVIARTETLRRPFAALKDDLETALRRLGAYRDRTEPSGER